MFKNNKNTIAIRLVQNKCQPVKKLNRLLNYDNAYFTVKTEVVDRISRNSLSNDSRILLYFLN